MRSVLYAMSKKNLGVPGTRCRFVLRIPKMSWLGVWSTGPQNIETELEEPYPVSPNSQSPYKPPPPEKNFWNYSTLNRRVRMIGTGTLTLIMLLGYFGLSALNDSKPALLRASESLNSASLGPLQGREVYYNAEFNLTAPVAILDDSVAHELSVQLRKTNILLRVNETEEKSVTGELTTSTGKILWSRSTADHGSLLQDIEVISRRMDLTLVTLLEKNQVSRGEFSFLAENKDTLKSSVIRTEIPNLSLSGKSLRSTIVDVQVGQKKALILHFWATWCAPCMAEMKHIEALSEMYKDAVGIVNIADERTNESLDQTRLRLTKVVDKYDALKDQYILGEGSTLLRDIFGADTIPLPAFALFDRGGVLREAFAGSLADPGSDQGRRMKIFLRNARN